MIKVGRRYKFGPNKQKKRVIETGRVVGEYGYYYLVDCGKYRTTILKNSLKAGDYMIREVGA